LKVSKTAIYHIKVRNHNLMMKTISCRIESHSMTIQVTCIRWE